MKLQFDANQDVQLKIKAILQMEAEKIEFKVV